MEFMEQTVLPPGFNLFPTPGGIHSVVEYIKALVRPDPINAPDGASSAVLHNELHYTFRVEKKPINEIIAITAI
ncbi:uncharacterized protein LOC122511317 [Leptopilina heterotoma]|uniref:uncharacterized protein LOC122511317 n=1 Tax=Leptopilina heterotoma TaxID=63436 RepID=UPI001CA80D6E|nr:uncharacterized protein LOC122511317 [Leptopilina heterotoma]